MHPRCCYLFYFGIHEVECKLCLSISFLIVVFGLNQGNHLGVNGSDAFDRTNSHFFESEGSQSDNNQHGGVVLFDGVHFFGGLVLEERLVHC